MLICQRGAGETIFAPDGMIPTARFRAAAFAAGISALRARRVMRSHLCICLVMTLCLACAAAEPWADARLSTTDGLELWLDAARAGAAGAGRDREAVEVWHDASGHER